MICETSGNLGLTNKKIGMLIFLASEIMFFTGLIGAYMVLRHTAKSWPDVSTLLNFRLGVLNSGIIIASSLVFVFGLKQLAEGKGRNAKTAWSAVIFLGILFLYIQNLEYRQLWAQNVHLSNGLFGAWFYVLTAFHGLHLLAGIICLAWFKAAEKPAGSFEALGLYWHFVDAVWLVLFLILYVIA